MLEHLRIRSPGVPTARTGRSPAAHEPVDRVRSTPPAGPPQVPFFRSRTQEDPALARMFLSARENAQRCAVDCAPYVHAKLQAVHHEHGPTGRPAGGTAPWNCYEDRCLHLGDAQAAQDLEA